MQEEGTNFTLENIKDNTGSDADNNAGGIDNTKLYMTFYAVLKASNVAARVGMHLNKIGHNNLFYNFVN